MVSLEQESEIHAKCYEPRLREHTKQGMPADVLIKVEEGCECAAFVSVGNMLYMMWVETLTIEAQVERVRPWSM